MRSRRNIQVVSAHAEGEVGDVIIGGVNPPQETHCGHSLGHWKLTQICVIFC